MVKFWEAMLTLGLMLSKDPFCKRHSRCCVWSPPIPKLREWSGSNSSFHTYVRMKQSYWFVELNYIKTVK